MEKSLKKDLKDLIFGYITILHSEGPDTHHGEDHQEGHPHPCPHQPHVLLNKPPATKLNENTS